MGPSRYAFHDFCVSTATVVEKAESTTTSLDSTAVRMAEFTKAAKQRYKESKAIEEANRVLREKAASDRNKTAADARVQATKNSRSGVPKK